MAKQNFASKFQVGKNRPKSAISSGKMAGKSRVRLGTFKGNHNVAHPVKQRSTATTDTDKDGM